MTPSGFVLWHLHAKTLRFQKSILLFQWYYMLPFTVWHGALSSKFESSPLWGKSTIHVVFVFAYVRRRHVWISMSYLSCLCIHFHLSFANHTSILESSAIHCVYSNSWYPHESSVNIDIRFVIIQIQAMFVKQTSPWYYYLWWYVFSFFFQISR